MIFCFLKIYILKASQLNCLSLIYTITSYVYYFWQSNSNTNNLFLMQIIFVWYFLYSRCQKTCQFLNAGYGISLVYRTVLVFSIFLDLIFNFEHSIVFSVSKYVLEVSNHNWLDSKFKSFIVSEHILTWVGVRFRSKNIFFTWFVQKSSS